MEKTVSNRTLELIKLYLPEIGLKLPLKDEGDVELICDFFEEMEVTLANADGCGEEVDQDLLDGASDAYDELVINGDDYHDIDDLNMRLAET